MSKENKAVEIEETVETTELVQDEYVDDIFEDEESKVKKVWNKVKKPLSYVGVGVLGLIGGLALASRGSGDDYIDDLDEEDFDVDVEITEE